MKTWKQAAMTAALAMLAAGGAARAADRYWVGSGNWSVDANWASSSGGAGGAGWPGDEDTAIFDGNGVNNATVDASYVGTVGAVDVRSGYTGAITQNRNLTVAGDFALASGATWKYTADTAATLNVDGNMTVNGTVQCQRTSTAGYGTGRSFTIGNNLSVGPTGKFDADSKGFESNGPGAQGLGSGQGRSHGGEGNDQNADDRVGPTYGSVTAPTALGSNGFAQFAGGGAIVFNVGGLTTVNGVMTAAGFPFYEGAGTGGSIFITTATFAGAATGAIRAHGGNASEADGGGGRVAVVLTGAGADFSGYAGTITAYGGAGSSWPGAAGTVYLEAQADGAGKGTLIVDNNNQSSTRRTLIGPLVTDAAVGDVVIRDSGRLAVNTNLTLVVRGGWSNSAAFSGVPDGAVEFAGPDTATIAGDTVFDTLVCTNAGKTLRFVPGGTQTITNRLCLAGAPGNRITLEPSDPAQQWNIRLKPTAAGNEISYLSVTNSHAGTPPGDTTITALNSLDQGGNVNWFFSSGPEPITWDGSASTDWNTAANWDVGRVPQQNDPSITISGAPANQPVLDKDYLAPGFDGMLVIQPGASLDLNGYSLRIGGAFTNAGALTAAGTETLVCEGDADFSGGAFDRAQSTFKLDGAGAQAFAPDGNTFYVLEIANTQAVTVAGAFAARDLLLPGTRAEVAFQEGFTVTNLPVNVTGGAALTFAAGRTYTVGREFSLRGKPGKDVVLSGSGDWNLNLGRNATARYVTVDHSDASGGGKVYAFDSTDNGNNQNWNFSGAKLWIGTTEPWTYDANWSPIGDPGPTNVVVIDGLAPAVPRITGGAIVKDLVVVGSEAAPAVLNVDMPFAGPDALSVTGDVLVQENATLTHSVQPDGDTESYRLSLGVGGDLLIQPGGAIDVSGRGFTSEDGPGVGGFNSGASHGGEGGSDTNFLGYFLGACYGSAVNPLRCGSGSAGRDGGGVAILNVNGGVVNNGVIAADGGGYLEGQSGQGGAAGGSVNISAGTLSGAGRISADGGQGSEFNLSGGGGGGRIAVVLSGADTFGDVTFSAAGGLSWADILDSGAAGTLYLKGQSDTGGRLSVSNRYDCRYARTQIPPEVDAAVGELGASPVTLVDYAAMRVPAGDKVGFLTMEGGNTLLDLGPAGTRLTLGEGMNIGGTVYTSGGVYRTNDWNRFDTAPTNVVGDGEIYIKPSVTTIIVH